MDLKVKVCGVLVFVMFCCVNDNLELIMVIFKMNKFNSVFLMILIVV